MGILELQESKDLLETLENVDQGVQQGNLGAQDLKDYLEWREDLVQWVLQVHLVLLVTQYQ